MNLSFCNPRKLKGDPRQWSSLRSLWHSVQDPCHLASLLSQPLRMSWAPTRPAYLRRFMRVSISEISCLNGTILKSERKARRSKEKGRHSQQQMLPVVMTAENRAAEERIGSEGLEAECRMIVSMSLAIKGKTG